MEIDETLQNTFQAVSAHVRALVDALKQTDTRQSVEVTVDRIRMPVLTTDRERDQRVGCWFSKEPPPVLVLHGISEVIDDGEKLLEYLKFLAHYRGL